MVTSDIHKHKQNIWKEHLKVYWDHRHSTQIPYTVYLTEHPYANSTLSKYSTTKEQPHPHTLSDTPHTRQTYPLAEQHRKKTYNNTPTRSQVQKEI